MEAVGVSGCAPLVQAQPRTGVFARMMVGLASEGGEDKVVMIDATYLTETTALHLKPSPPDRGM
jgi:hypothetical protein